jgi:hypothetical protein
MQFRTALTVAAVVLMSACTTAPIMNVDKAAVTTASGKSLTREQVRTAIVGAGAALGWVFKDEAPGLMVGTLNLRTHSAVIEIPYSESNYSVKYRSSSNLEEKGGGTIHKNYNGWIQNLQRGINARLSAS